MTESPDPSERAGWELIWRGDHIPPRYLSLAAPEGNVVNWANDLTPGGFVLDLGCGAGRHCIYLAKRGFRVAGQDIAPTGINMAQEACIAQGIPFDGKVSDMTTIPWPDSTFDAALSISTIHHHYRADIVKTMGEVWRVLKPCGMLLVDFPCVGTLDHQRLRAQVDAGEIVEPEPNTFVDERPQPADDDGFLPHHFCDEAEARDLLSEFEVIKVWAALHPAKPERGEGMVGKLIAWARKPTN